MSRSPVAGLGRAPSGARLSAKQYNEWYRKVKRHDKLEAALQDIVSRGFDPMDLTRPQKIAAEALKDERPKTMSPSYDHKAESKASDAFRKELMEQPARPVLGDGQALLCVAKNKADNNSLESVTVFVPWHTLPAEHKAHRPYSTYWGDLDICYSYLNTYLMLDRDGRNRGEEVDGLVPNSVMSGIYTGIPLPTETLTVLDKQEALAQAKQLSEAHRKQLNSRRYS